MIDLEKSQTTKVTIMLMIDLRKLKTTQWKQPNGSDYVNDKFEKAKNNPIVAIMLMIDVYKLKTTQHYSHVKWQISKSWKQLNITIRWMNERLGKF